MTPTPVLAGDDAALFRDRLARAHADAVVQHQISALVINVLLAVSAFPVLHRHGGLGVTSIWLAFVLLTNLARCAVARLYMASDRQDAQGYLRACLAGSLCSGLVWAAVPVVFLNPADPQSLFLIVILCGISAGAMVQAAGYAWTCLVFATPVHLSTIVVLLHVGTLESGILGFDIILFFTFLVKSNFTSMDTFRASLMMKHRATDLAAGLQDLANNDPLTSLPNRAFFGYALATRLEKAATDGSAVFLLLVDLDHFKSINDTLGHTAGDVVLKEVAARLSRADEGRHAVARLGGDEFAILLDPDCDDAAARSAAAAIVTQTQGAFVGCGHPVTIGVSAGLAKFPDDGGTGEELLARADLALYAAKDAGRQTWRRFDATLLSAANIARDIEQDLPAAMADGSLQFWLQPQIALDSGRLIGLEALIRWNHPRYGWLQPPMVVRAAVRLRISETFTGLLLDRACEAIKSLDARGLRDVLVAVNISPRELDLYSLPALVRDRIETHGIEPHRLEIEITEEALVAGEKAFSALNALAATGVRLAIDDFGTGYSSIAYLRSLRVHRIKIDRSFVTGFANRERDRILVRAILGIGRSFGIEVVAEGVETAEEATLLASFGCPLAQGYHFARPMAPATLQAWLSDRTIDRAA